MVDITTLKKVSKLKIFDIDTQESREEAKNHNQDIFEKGGDTYKTKFKARDGSACDVRVKAKVISVSGRKFCLRTWQNVHSSE